MPVDEGRQFESLTNGVGRIALTGKTVLIPDMARAGARLLAASFRSFGIRAMVMDTCKGLDLGQEYTSGKECYPCQITIGDVLHFLKGEVGRLGRDFDPEEYIYFLPEAEGPCRFGMYNKFQRIVLDSFPEFRKVKIGSVSTEDGYSLEGIIAKEKVRDLRKTTYFCVLVADILDRLLWRVRPYERELGSTDAFFEKSIHRMEGAFEVHGAEKDFDRILDVLDAILREGKALIDPAIPPKPLIGVVGEIYLRTHVQSNHDLLRMLEQYGAEVVNASIAEWVNYATYDTVREARIELGLNLRRLRLGAARKNLRKLAGMKAELIYQEWRQRQVYRRAKSLLDLADDHRVGDLEEILREDDLFSFDVGTEACLSIAGIVACAREGYNGIVNVYPFTCMPSTATSSIIRPRMNELRIPYLDTACDASVQPGREAAVRTFMFQAHQHFRRNGRKSHGECVTANGVTPRPGRRSLARSSDPV